MTRSRHASNEGGNSVISGFQFLRSFDKWRDVPGGFIVGHESGHDYSLAFSDFHAASKTTWQLWCKVDSLAWPSFGLM